MYSKNKGITYQPTVLTPPPGYDGSRFRRRSDGRDDTFPLYEEAPSARREPVRHESGRHEPVRQKPKRPSPPEEKDCPQCADNAGDSNTYSCHRDEATTPSPIGFLTSFISGIGKEELLLIALIIILSGEKGNIDTDTILLLALLLCAG